jgi:hypothetical protein
MILKTVKTKMSKISIVIVLLFILPIASKACIDYQTESFNLMNFDMAENIIEVEILSKKTNDFVGLNKGNYVDTLNFDKTNPQPPLPNFSPLYNDFNIKIITFHKGNKCKIDVLRTENLTSSCYWEPVVGEKYIFYLGKILIENQSNILNIQGCHRRLGSTNSSYKSEKKILKFLAKKNNGKFQIYQKRHKKNQEIKHVIFEGAFQNKKRNGIWVLYEPVKFEEKNVKEPKKVLILSYNDEIIKTLEYLTPTDKFIHTAFTSNWRFYYKEKVN